LLKPAERKLKIGKTGGCSKALSLEAGEEGERAEQELEG